MTQHFGRPARNGALIRDSNGRGLPTQSQLSKKNIPMKEAPQGQEHSNLEFAILNNPAIKPSPSYSQINPAKGIPQQPLPTPKKIVTQVKEVEELVIDY